MIVPASGGWTPQSTFTIVLLPAPFSPRRAWISPASHENSAPSSATTPPNRLSIPVALSRGIQCGLHLAKRPGRSPEFTGEAGDQSNRRRGDAGVARLRRTGAIRKLELSPIGVTSY